MTTDEERAERLEADRIEGLEADAIRSHKQIERLEADAVRTHDQIEGLEDEATRRDERIVGLDAEAILRDERIVELLDEVENLARTGEHQAVIEQAKGVIMGVSGCGLDAAFAVLVAQSQKENRKLWDIATELVNAQDHQSSD